MLFVYTKEAVIQPLIIDHNSTLLNQNPLTEWYTDKFIMKNIVAIVDIKTLKDNVLQPGS